MCKALLLDYDGTLLDSFSAQYLGTRNVFSNCGVQPPDFESFCRTYESPIEDFYNKHGITVASKDIYRWYLEVVETENSSFFPDVEEVIKYISERGVKIGIVSGNDGVEIERRCGEICLHKYLQSIHGHVPIKTESIVDFCRQHNVRLGDAYYVGDAISDMRDAKNAGVVAVGMMRGKPILDVLKQHGADYVINDLYGLLDLL